MSVEGNAPSLPFGVGSLNYAGGNDGVLPSIDHRLS